jgi:hypothetical protein
MNEKDIRDRIGQFLKKTARTVVVPASMGLGLTSTACNSNGLPRARDAGLDSGAAQSDAAMVGPDQADAAIKYDLPMMFVPYVVAMPPDAAADQPTDTAAQGADADRDVVPDAKADISFPPPPYLAPLPPDAATDVAREAARGDANMEARPDVRADMATPIPPYLMPPASPNELMGSDSPKSPAKK